MATLFQPDQLHIELPLERLAEFCRRSHITRLEVFGSALRADFSAESDIDFLVTYDPTARMSLFDEVRLESELGEIVGRPVDMVSRRAVEQSQNRIRKHNVLSLTRDVYVA